MQQTTLEIQDGNEYRLPPWPFDHHHKSDEKLLSIIYFPWMEALMLTVPTFDQLNDVKEEHLESLFHVEQSIFISSSNFQEFSGLKE
jgi:hypothetical protein